MIHVLKEHQMLLLTELHLLEICIDGLESQLPAVHMNHLYQENLAQIYLFEYNVQIINQMLPYYGEGIFNYVKL
jgi:hypothetical protein